jgi:Sulfate permease family
MTWATSGSTRGASWPVLAFTPNPRGVRFLRARCSCCQRSPGAACAWRASAFSAASARSSRSRCRTEGDSAWRELGSWLGSLGDVHGTTLLVGVSALGVILGLRRVAPAVPGALVLVAGGLLASSAFDLGAHDVALVGDVPRGLPVPAVPDLGLVADNYGTVAIAAFALLLIGFSQTAGDARAFAARHRYRIDVNQESVAQGMANMGAGVFQGDAGLDEPVGELAERVGGRARRSRRWSQAASCWRRCWCSHRCSRTFPRRCSGP